MEIKRSLKNENYVHIKMDNISFYGGDQEWWKNSNSVISKYGCGVIAMCDLELYFLSKCKKNNINNFIDRDTYIEYIDRRSKQAYKICALPFIKKLGLFPWKMARGIRDFFDREMGKKVKVRWAHSRKTDEILSMISGMVEKDIPVVASYDCTIKGKPIDYYIKDENGMIKKTSQFKSHYFTITGIDGDLFKISTYGESYFIFIQEWLHNVSFFTNILYIEMEHIKN